MTTRGEPPLVIVTGLPRSGTSMIMQSLRAAGVPVVEDGIRAPDAHNPKGYLEWQPLRRALEPGTAVDLSSFAGRAVKVISSLLPAVIPTRCRCSVIHIVRDLTSVVASQRAMMEAEGHSVSEDDEKMRELLTRQRARFERWLALQPRIETLQCEYEMIVSRPVMEMARLGAFVGAVDVAAMAKSVDAGLCHHAGRGRR